MLDLALEENLDTVFSALLLNSDEQAVGRMLRDPCSLVSLSDAGAELKGQRPKRQSTTSKSKSAGHSTRNNTKSVSPSCEASERFGTSTWAGWAAG